MTRGPWHGDGDFAMSWHGDGDFAIILRPPLFVLEYFT